MTQTPIIDRLWAPAEAQRVICQAKRFMGDEVVDLMQKHRADLRAQATSALPRFGGK